MKVLLLARCTSIRWDKSQGHCSVAQDIKDSSHIVIIKHHEYD
jgi:hypothetical protein